ncbi:uncharacterized protein At1g15400 [Brassica napus]|uniref:MAPK kinase substrate protein n=3 Tax=Brassica TaxID=3705 RepID=A0A0D3DX54_BRAOL|nr:PREDICTED: uncharacterized protein At1g15400-like [Brassica oleracea var. oleracea]XP_013712386.1 uncharacterized protein At1g15400 [Brassica napus]KAF3496943.1 hypothetical protein DY000_02057622 [Brassica cretica]CAF2115161.1 unnamed protein product [Brassica napus]
MEGLQRSTISFRRQGSSGIVFDDRVIAELNKQATEQKDESQRDEQPKPMSEGPEQEKPIAGDEKDKLRPIKTGAPTAGGLERSRSNGGGAPRHHRTTGRVSPAVDPPSPRLSTCGCCTAFGKKPPGKKNNPRKKPPKRRSR